VFQLRLNNHQSHNPPASPLSPSFTATCRRRISWLVAEIFTQLITQKIGLENDSMFGILDICKDNST